MPDDLSPRLGDWVASRASVKRRGKMQAMKWHAGDVDAERGVMVIHNHRYGLRRVQVADWVVVYRPGDSKR